MKRLIVALLVGGALFATVLGVAAGLGVASGALQSGSGGVVCDGDGVAVTYQDTDVNGTYDQATVRDVDCPGTYDVTVDVQNVGNGTLGYGTASTSGVTAVVALSNVLDSGDIASADHVHVTLVGTGP